jgi:hypothetical protein
MATENADDSSHGGEIGLIESRSSPGMNQGIRFEMARHFGGRGMSLACSETRFAPTKEKSNENVHCPIDQ